MYRLIIESLLGVRLEKDKLHFAPCLPADWPGFHLRYRYQETVYDIQVVQHTAPSLARLQIVVDGVASSDAMITLVDDQQVHTVQVSVFR
jgi:cyclic beta-1,2-glucan synthetase